VCTTSVVVPPETKSMMAAVACLWVCVAMVKNLEPAGAVHWPLTVWGPGPLAVAGGTLMLRLNDTMAGPSAARTSIKVATNKCSPTNHLRITRSALQAWGTRRNAPIAGCPFRPLERPGHPESRMSADRVFARQPAR
jgi:hypothetical protein